MSYVRSTNSPSFIAESEINCFRLRSFCMHVWSLPLTNIGNSRWEEEHILFSYMNANCLMKHASTKQCKYVVYQRLDNFDDFNFRELFGTIRVCFCDHFCLLLFVFVCYCLFFVFLLFIFCFSFFVVVFCGRILYGSCIM